MRQNCRWMIDEWNANLRKIVHSPVFYFQEGNGGELHWRRLGAMGYEFGYFDRYLNDGRIYCAVIKDWHDLHAELAYDQLAEPHRDEIFAKMRNGVHPDRDCFARTIELPMSADGYPSTFRYYRPEPVHSEPTRIERIEEVMKRFPEGIHVRPLAERTGLEPFDIIQELEFHRHLVNRATKICFLKTFFK